MEAETLTEREKKKEKAMTKKREEKIQDKWASDGGCLTSLRFPSTRDGKSISSSLSIHFRFFRRSCNLSAPLFPPEALTCAGMDSPLQQQQQQSQQQWHSQPSFPPPCSSSIVAERARAAAQEALARCSYSGAAFFAEQLVALPGALSSSSWHGG